MFETSIIPVDDVQHLGDIVASVVKGLHITIQGLLSKNNDLESQIDVLQNKCSSSDTRSNNPESKMLFEVLRYRYEREKDVPHVITFEDTSYNVGHAMNDVTGRLVTKRSAKVLYYELLRRSPFQENSWCHKKASTNLKSRAAFGEMTSK